MSIDALPLRGLQLPEQISYWPLATGWWIVIGGTLALSVSVWLFLRWRKHRLSTISQQKLTEISNRYNETKDSVRLATDVSMLLRQVVISVYPRSHAASVTSQEWLALLDKLGGDNFFTQGNGQQLMASQYSNKPLAEPQELITKVSVWLNRVISKPLKGGIT